MRDYNVDLLFYPTEDFGVCFTKRIVLPFAPFFGLEIYLVDNASLTSICDVTEIRWNREMNAFEVEVNMSMGQFSLDEYENMLLADGWREAE
jgi:hypothetical protein